MSISIIMKSFVILTKQSVKGEHILIYIYFFFQFWFSATGVFHFQPTVFLSTPLCFICERLLLIQQQIEAFVFVVRLAAAIVSVQTFRSLFCWQEPFPNSPIFICARRHGPLNSDAYSLLSVFASCVCKHNVLGTEETRGSLPNEFTFKHIIVSILEIWVWRESI